MKCDLVSPVIFRNANKRLLLKAVWANPSRSFKWEKTLGELEMNFPFSYVSFVRWFWRGVERGVLLLPSFHSSKAALWQVRGRKTLNSPDPRRLSREGVSLVTILQNHILHKLWYFWVEEWVEQNIWDSLVMKKARTMWDMVKNVYNSTSTHFAGYHLGYRCLVK